MSCTAYFVYTFHLSLHHANFGQFKTNRIFLFVSFRSIHQKLFFLHDERMCGSASLKIKFFRLFYIIQVSTQPMRIEKQQQKNGKHHYKGDHCTVCPGLEKSIFLKLLISQFKITYS